MPKKQLSTTTDPLLSEAEVETQTNGKIKAATLRNWRCNDRYTQELPHVKIGRSVYYRLSAVENFLSPESAN